MNTLWLCQYYLITLLKDVFGAFYNDHMTGMPGLKHGVGTKINAPLRMDMMKTQSHLEDGLQDRETSSFFPPWLLADFCPLNAPGPCISGLDYDFTSLSFVHDHK